MSSRLPSASPQRSVAARPPLWVAAFFALVGGAFVGLSVTPETHSIMSCDREVVIEAIAGFLRRELMR